MDKLSSKHEKECITGCGMLFVFFNQYYQNSFQFVQICKDDKIELDK